MAAGLVVGTAAGAWAVTVTAPASNPFTVSGDAGGNPQAFTITASGLAQNEAVFVQQCDGVSPTTIGYSATEHCDLASGNSPANANASGIATFSASDSSHKLNVFKGESPQSLFNCLSPNDPLMKPTNGLDDFRNCQVRVSADTPGDTPNQVYFSIVLPDAPAATTTTTTTTTVPTSGSTVGACGGLTAIGTLTPPLAGDGSNTTLTASAKDLKVGTLVEGAAPVLNRTAGGGQSCQILADAAPVVEKTSAKLSGVASCLASADTPPAQLAAQYPLNGKLSIKPSNQAYVRVAGFDPVGPDVIDLTGIVVKGNGLGATVGGSISFDPVIPVAKTKTPPVAAHYAFDGAQVANPCGGAGGTPIGLVFIADGVSLLGNAPSGISFSF